MALFRKKEKTTIAELEEYYANQKTKRSAKAWLMALLSLLITIAVIVALFFAGRWVYNTFFNNDDNNVEPETAEQGEQVDLPTYDSDSFQTGGVSFEEGTSDNPDDLVVEEGQSQDGQVSGSQTGGTVSDEAATTTDSNADRVDSNSDEATGDDFQTGGTGGEVAGSTNNSPNTGPGETMFVILIVTAVLGYLGSRKYQLSK